SGSGRTFLCDMLQHSYPAIHTFRIEPQLLFGDRVLISLCRQYSLEPNPSASMRFLAQVFVSHALPEDQPNATAVIVVDTVDPSDLEVLSDIYEILANRSNARLVILLVGDNDLPDQLAANGAPELLYTGAPPVSLRAMTQDEIAEYVTYRMETIGGSSAALKLDKAARQLLHVRSRGNPKLVNIYCHNALTIAALLGQNPVRFSSMRLGMKRKVYLSADAARALIDGEQSQT
ncbi:MAG: AAA family ATPase, partial [Myxococcota bacterium]